MAHSTEILRTASGSYALGPFDIVRVQSPEYPAVAWNVGDRRTGEGLDVFRTYAEAKRYAWQLAIAENEKAIANG